MTAFPRAAAGLAAAVVTLGASATGAEPYPAMAPLAQYLIADRNAEIALARSAAPAAVSASATILVLGPHGYETAVKGKNGFTCLVERGWTAPFDHPEFWNPKLRGPVCYNAAATRSVLPYTMRRTQLALSGQSRPKMLATLNAEASRMAPPAPGSMSYMLSHGQYLNDGEHHAWHPHLMFHMPRTDAAAWGADAPDSPVIVDTTHRQVPEPQTIFMLAASKWSDGTPDTPAQSHVH